MPEGPEVKIVADFLNKKLENKIITELNYCSKPYKKKHRQWKVTYMSPNLLSLCGLVRTKIIRPHLVLFQDDFCMGWKMYKLR